MCMKHSHLCVHHRWCSCKVPSPAWFWPAHCMPLWKCKPQHLGLYGSLPVADWSAPPALLLLHWVCRNREAKCGCALHLQAPRRRVTAGVGRQRTSQYMGVGSSNRKGVWQARILVHGKVWLSDHGPQSSVLVVPSAVALSLTEQGCQLCADNCAYAVLAAVTMGTASCCADRMPLKLTGYRLCVPHSVQLTYQRKADLSIK